MCVFFKDNLAQKEYIGKQLKKVYPEFVTGGDYYRGYLKKYLKSNMVVLDAGCGDYGIIPEFRKIPKLIIGLDEDKDLLEKNKIVHKKIVANLEKIPMDDDSVDLVTSEFVLEHVEKPDIILKEIFRVLKPNGKFIFITPNVLNPVMVLSKILPHFIHELLRSKLLKKQEETHRTNYRANTYRKLKYLGKKAGFQNLDIVRAGNPEYLAFCKPLVLPSILIERFIDNKLFSILKMYLIACFKKI